MQQSANIVIIGGGVIGCSIAYHLTKMGQTKVLVLEQFQLTHGATWHAAGVVGQLRPSRNVTHMLGRGIALYDALQEDTGQAIDWKKVGSLRIASSKDRMMEYRRAATTAKSFGLQMQLLDPDETQSLFPIMSLEDVERSAYIESDGYVDPESLCQAYAAGARQRGAARMRRLTIGAAPVRAQRVSYTGELAFELHVPTEYAAHVYEQLSAVGEQFGIADVGYRALNSLRMEKGYLAWAGDLTPDYTPYHADLERFVDYEKGNFIGREALLETRERGPGQRLCVFSLNQKAPAYGGEAILRNGKVLATSGDFGHTVGKPIVMGYVPSAESGFDDSTIEVFGEAIGAQRHAEAPYDPAGKRVRS